MFLLYHVTSRSSDIIDLTFQVTLQDHVIKRPCDFKEGSTSLHIPMLSSLDP